VGALGTLVDSFHGPVVTMGSLAQSDGEGALVQALLFSRRVSPEFCFGIGPS